MVKEHQVEYGDNAQVFVTITVGREQIKDQYDRLVDEYCKKVQIKGFRRGKVPPSILIRKFGDALLGETQEKIVEASLGEVLEKVERKPLPYSAPTPTAGPPKEDEQGATGEQQQSEEERENEESNPDDPALEEDDLAEAPGEEGAEPPTLPPLSLEEDYRYTVVYDTFPEIELGEYKGLEVEEPQWEITEEDIGRELESIQEQNALVVEKKEDTVEEGDIVTMDYWELTEEGSERPGTKREGFVFEVGTGYNLYGVDQEILGMHTGEQRTIRKSYDAEYEHEELRNREVVLSVTITSIREKKLPEIDDELAQDISEKFETLDDLKADIRRKLEETARNRVRDRMIGELLAKIAQKSTVPVPRSMVALELEQMWREFVGHTGGDEKRTLQFLQLSGQGKEDLYERWVHEAASRVTLALLRQELLKREGIEVSDEELNERIREYAEQSDLSPEQARSQLEGSGYLDAIKTDIRNRKLNDRLLEQAAVKPGEKLSFLDLMGRN